MATFKYKALTKEGKTLEGIFTAKKEEEVISMLRQNDYLPISVKEEIIKKDISSLTFLTAIKIKDIAVFCRQFCTMLRAGVTIMNCLDILKLQTENKRLREIIAQVSEDVQKGLTLSEALTKHSTVFPELLINMVEAGEVSGSLDDIMERLSLHYEKEYKINNKIKGAMVYPIALGVISVGVVIFLLTFVMPTFLGMFEGSGVELPGPTKFLLALSDALKSFWYIFAGVIILAATVLNLYVKTTDGRLIVDSLKFRLPIIGPTTQKIVTSRFTRTLATLLKNGIPLIQALEIVSKVVGNKVAAEGILKAKEDVNKGVVLSRPIKEMGIFPPMVDSMIQIGEEAGALDDILDNTANFYDEEVEVAIQKMTTMLEPIMIVTMAIVIGFIVIAMVLPMFDMINTVQM